MSVPINREVHAGIEHVRATRYNESGHTHMLDVERVQALARHEGFEATASWIEDHEEAYAEGVLFGFEIIGDSLDYHLPEGASGERA